MHLCTSPPPALPPQVGSESRRSRRRPSFDGMSPPSTLASTRWVSPSDTPYSANADVTTDGGSSNAVKALTPAAAAAADGSKAAASLSSSFMASEGPSDAMSDQGSPVDPRQVSAAPRSSLRRVFRLRKPVGYSVQSGKLG